MSDAELEAQNDLTPDDDDDDDDGTTEEREENSEPTPAPPRPVGRPRARPAPGHVGIGVFGAVPVNARAWGMSRATLNGGWEPLKHGDGGTLHEEWPISELSEETVRARWGAGTFRASWWTATPKGGKKFVCNGRTVTFQAPTVVAPPAPPASSLGGLADALHVMRIIDEQATAKLDNLATLARMFQQQPAAAVPPAGPTFAEIKELMREEREATRAMIAEALGDDEDEEENPVVEGARAIARPMFRGKAWWQQIGNFANENPEVVKSVAPIVLGAVQNVAAVVAAAVTTKPAPKDAPAPTVPPAPPAPPPPPTPPPATTRERPRAVAVPVDDRNDPPPVDNVVSLKPQQAETP